MKPKFTIVMPTRERSETLRYALRTCLNQRYEPLEIIVSDNASRDDTRAVVESFGDPRIRYVNTGRRVSMSRNWEFALSHVTGDFVTYVGDDDGLLPNAVADVAMLIAKHDARALSWNKSQYCWPNHPLPDHPGLLSIPLTSRLFVCDAHQFAVDCARLWTSYHQGPSLYNAFVSVPVIHAIRQKTDGVFFHSVIPDAYSSIAIASGLKSYLYSSRPFSVNGASGASNGANTANYFKDEADEQNATRTFIEEADLPMHPDLPVLIIGSTVAVVFEAILQANDRCFGGSLPVDVERSLKKIVREVSRSEADRHQSVIRQLLEVTGAHPGRRRAVQAALSKYPNRPLPAGPPAHGLGTDDVFWTNVTELQVQDVQRAADFVHAFLGPYVPPPKTSRYSHYSKILTRAFAETRARLNPHLW